MNTIYFDLDGVLADFDTYCVSLIGRSLNSFPDSQSGWDALGDNKLDMYLHLPIMKDAEIIVSEVFLAAKHTGYNVGVLTALPKYGRVPNAKKHKKEWLMKYFPLLLTDFNIGPWAEDKQKHCVLGDILIDDHELNISQWYSRGGVGIHHTSVNDTLDQLYRLLN